MKALYGILVAVGLAAASVGTAEAGYRSYGHGYGHSYSHGYHKAHSYGHRHVYVKRHYGHRHFKGHGHGYRVYGHAPVRSYKYVPRRHYAPVYGYGRTYTKPSVVIVRPAHRKAVIVQPRQQLKSTTGVVQAVPTAADTAQVGAPIGPQVDAAPAAPAQAQDTAPAQEAAPAEEAVPQK